jgi:hypothetical protein
MAKATKSRTIHVFHHQGGWAVRREGSAEGGIFRRRADAVAEARRRMIKSAPAQVVVHTKDGRVASVEVRGLRKIPRSPVKSSLGTENIQRAVFNIVRERLLSAETA